MILRSQWLEFIVFNIYNAFNLHLPARFSYKVLNSSVEDSLIEGLSFVIGEGIAALGRQKF